MINKNRLEDSLVAADQQLYKLFDSFNRERITSRDLASSIWYIEELKAANSIGGGKGIDGAKQHFYTCGILDEYLINKFDERILDYGIDHISYVILSDNIPLMERYAQLSHKHYTFMVEKGHSTPVYIIQQIIAENWEKVAWGIDIMDNKTVIKNKALKPDRDFYEALLNGNAQNATIAITQLLNDHKKRNKYKPIINEFITTPALGYTKLAWLKGMKLDIAHPLVPKALLPFKPLDKYDDQYAFLIGNP